MNRSFDIFRMSANGADPDRGTARWNQMRARTNRHQVPELREGYDAAGHRMEHYRPRDAGYGDERERERERDPRDYPSPPARSYGYDYGRELDYAQMERTGVSYGRSTYGNVPYDRSFDRSRLDEHMRQERAPWRGRDEEHDFWGRERHPEHEHPSVWERVKGAFTGRGPKNWKRADERIREDVCERLCYHPYVDASDIDVIVRDGEVTLTGTVDARMAKRAAEDVAHEIRGVHDVHNQLRVRRESP